MKKEKEFNLSKERESFYKETLELAITKDEELLLNTIFQFINNQDKEFIKRLKEEMFNSRAGDLCGHCEGFVTYKIDKLAGPDLI